jgi:hypothetical protein
LSRGEKARRSQLGGGAAGAAAGGHCCGYIWDLSARARPFLREDGEPLVQLKCGGVFYLLELDEARRLLAELTESIAEAEAPDTD